MKYRIFSNKRRGGGASIRIAHEITWGCALIRVVFQIVIECTRSQVLFKKKQGYMHTSMYPSDI